MKGRWILLGEIAGAVWVVVKTLSIFARNSMRQTRIAGAYMVVWIGEGTFSIDGGIDGGIETWLEVAKTLEILEKSNATAQGQVPGVHRWLFGEHMLSHEQVGVDRLIQGVLHVSHGVLIGYVVACAVATSAPLLVLTERHPASKTDRSVLGRAIQSTAVTLHESRTYRCRH